MMTPSLCPPAPRTLVTSAARTLADQLTSDEQEERSRELEGLKLHTKADRVRSCASDPRGVRVCRQRACPSCAAQQARRNAARAATSSSRFGRPCLATLTVGPRTVFALESGLNDLQQGIARWKRSAVVRRFVLGAVAGVEPKFSAGPPPRWLVHAHAVLDCSRDADFSELARAWSAATAGKGRLLLPKGGPDVRDPLAAASYLAKHADWSPRPGTMPLSVLGALFDRIRYRRLLLRWGSAKAR